MSDISQQLPEGWDKGLEEIFKLGKDSKLLVGRPPPPLNAGFIGAINQAKSDIEIMFGIPNCMMGE